MRSRKSRLVHGCTGCAVRTRLQGRYDEKMPSADEIYRYHSVRIDAVHFCPLEQVLADQRKKKSIEASSIIPTRFKLFERTMQHRRDIARSVLYLKLPFMMREMLIADLSRTVAALKHLRYVDLPEGFYSADNSTIILRSELEKCQDLRKMRYTHNRSAKAEDGEEKDNLSAEQAFEVHAKKPPKQPLWRALEVLELDELKVDLAVLRYVLKTFLALRELTCRNLPYLDDTAFQSSPNLPDFPPLQTLKFRSAPGITARGLQAYVTRPEVSNVLSSLSLTGTSVTIPTLHLVLNQASHLSHLSITEEVTGNFPLDPVAPLASSSLRTLNFEVTSSSTNGTRAGLTVPSDSHYAYLASSLHANGLPALRKLYVRHSQFPQLLLMPPSAPGQGFNPRVSMAPPLNPSAPPLPSFPKPRGRPGTFNQPLEIYAKGAEDLEWAFTSLSLSDGVTGATNQPNGKHFDQLAPPTAPFANGARPGSAGSGSGRRGSAGSFGRPVSAYYASQSTLGPQWGGEARKSVFMGNGQGGFLAVPNGDQALGGSVEEDFPAPRRPWADGSNGRPGSSNGRPGSSGGLGGMLGGLGHKSKPSRGLWR